jgi:hypothetical protein
VTDVKFARSGDVDIAYHVVGDGPVDLVYVEGAYTSRSPGSFRSTAGGASGSPSSRA